MRIHDRWLRVRKGYAGPGQVRVVIHFKGRPATAGCRRHARLVLDPAAAYKNGTVP
jgi:hypothetical protein